MPPDEMPQPAQYRTPGGTTYGGSPPAPAPAPGGGDEPASAPSLDKFFSDRKAQHEQRPANIDDLKSWASSLAGTYRDHAAKLDVWLQQQGKKGLLDPTLTPAQKKAVDELFSATVGHWNSTRAAKAGKKGKAPAGPGEFEYKKDPDMKAKEAPEFKPRGQLPKVDDAVSALGGTMMEEESDA